jgi:endoglucanase
MITTTIGKVEKLKCFIVTIACLALPSVGSAAAVFPNPGVNLGNTLEALWPYTPPTKALIDGMKNAGFKTLRVPCSWSYNSTNGTINAAYMTQVTNVVNWAISDGMYVIINDHYDNGWFERNGFNSYDSNINSKLISLWTQVANNFKWTDSVHLAFACANEPDAPSQAQTNVLYQYEQNWINAMRANGGGNAVRWLIVQGPNTNIDETCNWGKNLPSDPANKRMVEVHDYDPFDFTLLHADQSWGTWKAFWGYNYHVSKQLTNRNVTAGNDESLHDIQLAKMQTNFTNRGIPVLVGEYKAEPQTDPSLTGSYKDQNYRSCTHWDKYIENKINSLGFSGTCWNIQNDLFDATTGAVLDWNMLNAMLGNSEWPPISGL